MVFNGASGCSKPVGPTNFFEVKSEGHGQEVVAGVCRLTKGVMDRPGLGERALGHQSNRWGPRL